MRYVLALILPFAMSGCMLELLTTTAIQGELAARDAKAGAQALNYAKESQSKMQAQSAIRAYQAETGKYPASLSILVPEWMPSLPVHPDGSPYGYDPSTGALLDSPSAQPVPLTDDDRRNIGKIEDAIYAYWQATQDYPRSLADLQPLYIDRVPMASSGASFGYDPQTGAVGAPGAAQAPPAPRAPVGGAGPLGEVSTGIAIQNQLSNMNSSGTQATGGYARRGLQGIGNAHDLQQQRALNQIDQ
jgi:hypothetical protein